MADSKDTKKELETSTSSKLPTQCKECNVKLFPLAKFCAMCGWKIPQPPPPSLADILSTKFETSRLIYDAKSLRETKWTDTLGNLAPPLDRGVYGYGICYLIRRQVLPNLAICREDLEWAIDGSIPKYTWGDIHHQQCLANVYPSYDPILGPWEKCSIPLLGFAGIPHIHRSMVGGAGGRSIVKDKFMNVLAKLVKYGIHYPRCGYAFEVKSSLSWDKMFEWYNGSHPKQHEYTAETSVTITFEEFDEKYYEQRANIYYDSRYKTKAENLFECIQSCSLEKTAWTADMKNWLIAQHAGFTHAQNVLDDLLAKLPEQMFMYKQDGKPTFLTKDEMLRLLNLLERYVKPLDSHFERFTIAKTTIFIAKPEIDIIVSKIASMDKMELAIRGLPLKEGATHDDVWKLLHG